MKKNRGSIISQYTLDSKRVHFIEYEDGKKFVVLRTNRGNSSEIIISDITLRASLYVDNKIDKNLPD